MFCCLVADAVYQSPVSVLEHVARACSPDVAVHGNAVVFDAAGCQRAIGPPATIAREVQQLAIQNGVSPRVAMALTVTAAWLLAHAQPGRTIVQHGEQA